MSEIKSIIIQRFTGFVLPGTGYKETLTLVSDSISCVYQPAEPSESHPPRKWTYRTQDAAFKSLFREVAATIPEILDRGPGGLFDVGGIEFTITYEDGSKKNRVFYLTSEFFRSCFTLIQRMVPEGEEMPVMLRLKEPRG